MDEMGQSGGTAPESDASGTGDVTSRTDWSAQPGPVGAGWGGPGGQAARQPWAPDQQAETPSRQPSQDATPPPWSRQSVRPSTRSGQQNWSDDLGGDGLQPRFGASGERDSRRNGLHVVNGFGGKEHGRQSHPDSGTRYADLLNPAAPLTAPPPASAPPYPYEGDLEDLGAVASEPGRHGSQTGSVAQSAQPWSGHQADQQGWQGEAADRSWAGEPSQQPRADQQPVEQSWAGQRAEQPVEQSWRAQQVEQTWAGEQPAQQPWAAQRAEQQTWAPPAEQTRSGPPRGEPAPADHATVTVSPQENPPATAAPSEEARAQRVPRQWAPEARHHHPEDSPKPTRRERRYADEPEAEEVSVAAPDDVQAAPAAPDVLPQRIPGVPDLPPVPDADRDCPLSGPLPPGRPEPGALARIATYLRDDDPDLPREQLDVSAVLAAVRAVQGVRGADVRINDEGVHTLRLELADGADPGQVSRDVARLLEESMGLAAGPPRHTPVQAAPVAEVPNAGRWQPPAPRSPEEQPEPEPAPPVWPPAQPHAESPVRGQARGRAVVPGQGPRLALDRVQVSTLGLDATVEVRLTVDGRPARGVATGPAVDGYLLRLAAVAAASALDQVLGTIEHAGEARCFVEHVGMMPFGSCEVAVVVLLLASGGFVEQLTGSALVSGDPRQAVVRATLDAVTRRVTALLP